MIHSQIIEKLRRMWQREVQIGMATKAQKIRVDEIESLIKDIWESEEDSTKRKYVIPYNDEDLEEVVAGYFGDHLILVHPKLPAIKIKEIEYAFNRYDKVSNEAIYKIIKNRKAA